MSAPATANEVVQHLAALTRDLQRLTDEYSQAETELTDLRCDADELEAVAYMQAGGTIPEKERAALLVAKDAERKAAKVESHIRRLKRQMATVERRIDVGRTYGATVRAELKTLGLDGQT